MDLASLVPSEQPGKLSEVLKGYYNHVLRGKTWGLYPATSAPSVERLPNFVVGSDGYIYEGRGWHHLGNHTRGQNPYGYGVAFIGNYSSSLPSLHTLDLIHCQVCSGWRAPAGQLHPPRAPSAGGHFVSRRRPLLRDQGLGNHRPFKWSQQVQPALLSQ
uniref:Peptidoglycan recognition protein family domain-containing protein n=1 Tax=Oncorhynchus tshawytscha TaxID=74940 RepID=A0AAZ3RJ33_ONCTS